MKVRCVLDDIRKHLGMSIADLHAETGIDRRSLANLLDDKGWRLDRLNYERLTRFAFDHGYETVLHIEHHPLWSTFDKKARTTIFRGSPNWDADIERNLSRFLQHIGGKPTMVEASEKVRLVEKAMKETNCIFVGSPKSNPSSEVALCLLSGAKPFDGSIANRRKVPVQIIGVDASRAKGSAVLVPSRQTHGFEITRTARHTIRVHWLPLAEYERWHDDGDDAAVVVVCPSPLGTSKPVTTILLLGYTGLATQSAARQLTHGEPPLSRAQLAERGGMHVLAYRFQFTKPHIASSRSTADPRREIADTGAWELLA